MFKKLTFAFSKEWKGLLDHKEDAQESKLSSD